MNTGSLFRQVCRSQRGCSQCRALPAASGCFESLDLGDTEFDACPPPFAVNGVVANTPVSPGWEGRHARRDDEQETSGLIGAWVAASLPTHSHPALLCLSRDLITSHRNQQNGAFYKLLPCLTHPCPYRSRTAGVSACRCLAKCIFTGPSRKNTTTTFALT